MDLDPVLLARIQFGFTISFHIIFPSFTIGLAAYIATLLGDVAAHRTRSATSCSRGSGPRSSRSRSAWAWCPGSCCPTSSAPTGAASRSSPATSIGPAIGYEVLTAFFLEATFLGVLLFGWNRVPPWLSTLSAAIVAFGTAISAFWILSANSWMQTPAGHEVRDGIAYPVDWLAIIFNPSFPYRLAHMLTAAYLTTAFVVLAVGARYLVAGRHEADGRTMVRMAIGMIAVLAPLQLFIGDQHGLNTLKHQPIKIAAMEAHWDGSKPGDFHIFAWPDEKNEVNRFAISIPRGSSLILTHDPNGLFPGLEERAAVGAPAGRCRCSSRSASWSASASLMIATGLARSVPVVARQAVRRRAGTCRSCSTAGGSVSSRCCAAGSPPRSGASRGSPHGILRTADAISPVTAASVLVTLVLFVIVYGIVFTMGIYYINRLIVRGPQGKAIEPSHGRAGPAARRRERRRARSDAAGRLRWNGTSRSSGPALIGAAVALYVILDGFDLGIGILFPFAKEDKEQDQMINSIAPFWDGNETWLVLGGGGLWVAFPHAYAVVMPALYLPVIVMLLALVFRGVAFEFRTVADTSKKYWTFAFAGGSTLAAFCQGLILGGLIQGIKVRERRVRRRHVRFRHAVRAAVRRSASSPAMRCSAPAGSR